MAVMIVKTSQLDSTVAFLKRHVCSRLNFLPFMRENSGWFEVIRLLAKAKIKRLRTNLKHILVDYLELAPVPIPVPKKAVETESKPKSVQRVVNNEANDAYLVNNEKIFRTKKHRKP